MIIRRYLDPITEINAIRRQINDVFGELTTEALTKADWAPAVRLIDQGDEFVLTTYLAGVLSADLDVQVSADTVSISGTRNQPAPVEDEVKVLYDDTRYGSFHRLVNLPDAVQNDQVAAHFTDGVLTLTLPKVVEARNKVVKISLGDTASPALEAGEAEA
ncbi:Hsp20/alpha crystallin family protein [Nodosilinea sp. LEGE 07088]|uniref:Hsp20/alpha crystallin family protein n=1 Tax=Nodosilinea sp. LEGE 07088 TaxID=2777968 RepID=UPI00187FCB07|nr:Hsp20/alpha crystallin family protein [Nodosilinea sp. LEGE 07088]MBE9135884.1 Hsp20/alpha crystallin family protein [Nodosilinea sp. LEGE 07088]